ncbi:MAG: hypothetical protein AB1599_03525 [Planctomycetota bacterium]
MLNERFIFLIGIGVIIALSSTGCVQINEARASRANVINDGSVISQMLRSGGLSKATARLSRSTLERLISQQKIVQPHFLRYWENPYEFPKFVSDLARGQEKNITDSTKGMFEQFGISQIRTGQRASYRYEFVPALEPKKEMPIQNALMELAKVCLPAKEGRTIVNDTDKVAMEKVLRDVPAELQVYIAKLILGAGEAKYFRDRALRNYPKERRQHAFDCAVSNFTVEDETAEEEMADMSVVNWDLGQMLDYGDLYAGAGINLKVICELEKFLAKPETEIKTEDAATPTVIAVNITNLAFEIETLLGKIAFNSKIEDNIYQCEDYLAIIDIHGNDTYKGPAAASYKLEHPISTIIDWSGNDTYTADEKTPCAQGAGILGYGFLVDNGGDDTFTAVNNAQGMCYFGVGILWDRSGDDSFKAHTSAQGSASFGVANLVKFDGNDSYYAYYTSQGFGFVGSYGCLIDTAGNDRYVAEPYDLVHQAKWGHDNLRNYSFCQGAGWGQRGDIFGGHSMGGGTGILQDLAGDDHYECRVYGQATGYWYGTGILYDKSGNDRYEGSFFVQSGTAHMGLTMLWDEAGNDKYHVWRGISQAGAHDYSVSILMDKGGDNNFSGWGWKDKEGSQTLTDTGVKGAEGGTLVGSAINNSIAIFVSLGGNDTYEYFTKDSFGWSFQNSGPDSWRYDDFNIGLFIDIGGNDTYNTPIEAGAPPDWGISGNDSSWSRLTRTPGNPNRIFSMGFDAAQGRLPEIE